ncbi:FtsK/SpoIIIE family DNA translocase [Risungbinella massiliensis]|uniref:FtsK/SpoIIIE family DNA translocase n=1 Tax=Risungbinella massiliensis TaxID=1329796 RepID=UPI0005CBBED2|nr:DNA translocase FtsK [Risungbinella massiliensis]
MGRKRKTLEQEVSKKEKLKQELIFEIYGIAILAVSIITMASFGAIGRNLTYLSRFIVGNWDFLIPLLGVGVAFYVMIRRRWPKEWSPRLTGILIVLLSLLALNHFHTFQVYQEQGFNGSIMDKTWNLLLEERNHMENPSDVGGGMVGAVLYTVSYFLFDEVGTVIVIGAFISVGILLSTGFSYVKFLTNLRENWKLKKGNWKEQLASLLLNKKRTKKRRRSKQIVRNHEKEDYLLEVDGLEEHEVGEARKELAPIPISDFEDHPIEPLPFNRKAEQMRLPLEQSIPSPENTPDAVRVNVKTKNQEPPLSEDSVEVTFTTKPEEVLHYEIPPFDLIQKPDKAPSVNRNELSTNGKKLASTLQSFGVQVKVVHIHRGPAVTRYELQPEVGVKVSRVVSLADDIALALAAKGIRIEAPIPGKSAIGIEVPNSEISMVGLRDILEANAYQKEKSKLAMALGRDIAGEPVVGNLAKMPHLLIAGATGAGKSVCINAILISLLYKAKPDEVKLMMIDPKMVELNVYNGIPHLLAPVVTDPRKAAIALKKVVQEMEKRYERFAKNGARDIERYNQIAQENPELERLPYIVVVVDELADLMMVAPADVEDAICRLAQMARAAGIHLIIATQRPSVDVITGVIKANIPSRIAFAVSSSADSRTILDMGGAEKLLGRGDMLYLPIGASKPTRVQGTYLSDEEVEAVVQFVQNQQKPDYQEEMIPTTQDVKNTDDFQDELFEQAIELVIDSKTASVSMLQRRFRIGYSRAARLIDMLEARGVVGPYEGSKPREVLWTREQLLQEKQTS